MQTSRLIGNSSDETLEGSKQVAQLFHVIDVDRTTLGQNSSIPSENLLASVIILERPVQRMKIKQTLPFTLGCLVCSLHFEWALKEFLLIEPKQFV